MAGVVGATLLFLWSRSVDYPKVFQEGLAACEAQNWLRAGECSERLSMNPQFQPHAFLLRGLQQKSEKRYAIAFQTFSKANDHPDTREYAYHEAATMLYEGGQFSQVILMCQQVLQWYSDRTATHRLLAAAYYDIGAMEQAITTLQQVIQREPSDYRPHYMQATILHDFERFEDASAAYDAAAQLVPKDSLANDEVLAGWGECLVRLRKFEQALSVMKLAADWPAVEAQRAVALFSLRQTEAALAAAESALKAMPLHPEAAIIAAQCYELSGESKRSIELLDQVLELHPNELQVHLKLAEILSATGAQDEALAHREAAGRISDLRRRFSHKQQELVRNDDNAALRAEVAAIAEQLGKFKLARTWLRAAAGMASSTPEIQSQWQQFQIRHSELQQVEPGLKSTPTGSGSPVQASDF